MSSGVPIWRRMSTASWVRWPEYDEMPTYSALPCRTAVSSAPIVSSSGVVVVEPVRVEDVDVVEAQPLQRLVERGEDVLARAAALAVGTGPHVVARLGRDDHLVAVAPEVLARRCVPKLRSAEPYGGP